MVDARAIAFGKRLKAIRVHRGMSQVELAGLIGVRDAQVGHWEHGRQGCLPILQMHICEALCCTLRQLQGRDAYNDQQRLSGAGAGRPLRNTKTNKQGIMADLVITGALDTDHIGDIVFKPLTEQNNPGKIDTITPTVISGDGTATVDPANPLVYTVDGVSATDSVIEFTVDMKPGAEVMNYVIELHLTGTEPGTVAVNASFENIRLRPAAPTVR